MRRALAILKYVPALLCGLLVVAWVTAFRWHASLGHGRLEFKQGSVIAGYSYGEIGDLLWILSFIGWGEQDNRSRLSWAWEEDYGFVGLPAPFLLTCLMPVVIGCLVRFRFPLWSYFAWTALIAAELAYYLR